MNTAPTGESLDFQGVSERLKTVIANLTDSSKRLQKAIVSRDVDTVWKIITEQQEYMIKFDKYNYLWKQIVVDSGIESPRISELKNELFEDIGNLKKTGNKNAILIRSFMSAINKAFKRTMGRKNQAEVYGKKGKMSYKQSSMLINRVG